MGDRTWRGVTLAALLAVAVLAGALVVFDSDSPVDAVWPASSSDDGYEPSAFTPPDPETNPGRFDGDHRGFVGFDDVTAAAGLDYETVELTQLIPARYGAYVLDVDNDGYEDLLLIGGEKPALFENTGEGYEHSRTFNHTFASAAHALDYNNNGYRDLLVASFGGRLTLYENRNGTFVERPDAVPERIDTMQPVTVTSADFSGNGCLDIYVGSWLGTESERPMSSDEFVAVGRNHPEVRPTTDNGSRNHLLAGDCDSFEDVTERAGVGGSAFTLAVSAADFTGNGHVDIHVGNDFTGDSLYENHGNLSFEHHDMGPASDRNAMSSATADVTGNHRLDIFVTNVYFEGSTPADRLAPVLWTPLPRGNNLFANEGGGEFTDIAPDHGLQRGGWGWAATVADYTNDGHLDIVHGSSYTNPAVVDDQPDIFRPPQLWTGTADSWEKVHGGEVGLGEHNLRGIARVDYRNDGTLDLVFVDNPSRAVPGVQTGTNRSFLYENSLDSDESLQLWVRNPEGLERNAAVYIETDERTIYREATARGGLLSQDSRLIHVGTASETVERVVVVWPDGSVTGYDSPSAGTRYILTPDDARPVT